MRKKTMYVIIIVSGIIGFSFEKTLAKARPLFLNTYSVKKTTISEDIYKSFTKYVYKQSTKNMVIKLADQFEQYNFHFYNSYIRQSKRNLTALNANKLPGFYLILAYHRRKKVVRYLVHFNRKGTIDLIGFFNYTSRHMLNQVVIYALSALHTTQGMNSKTSFILKKIVKSHVVTHKKNYSRIINYYYTNNHIDYFINIKNNHRQDTSILCCYSLHSHLAKQPVYKLQLKNKKPVWARINQFAFREKKPGAIDMKKFLFSPQIEVVTITNLFAYACEYYFNVQKNDSCAITIDSFHNAVSSTSTILYPAKSSLLVNEQTVMKIETSARFTSTPGKQPIWLPDIRLTLGNNVFIRKLKEQSFLDNTNTFTSAYNYRIDNSRYSFSVDILKNNISSEIPYTTIHWDEGIQDFFYRLDYNLSRKQPGKGKTWYIDSLSMPDINNIIRKSQEYDTIIIKTGIYHISNSILFHNKKNLIIKGVGTVRIVCNNQDTHLIRLRKSRNILMQNISLSFKGLPTHQQYAATVISLDRCYFVTIDACELYGAGKCAIDSTACAHLTIQNSYIHHNAIAAFAIDTHSRDITITHNRLIHNSHIFFKKTNFNQNNAIVFSRNSVW